MKTPLSRYLYEEELTAEWLSRKSKVSYQNILRIARGEQIPHISTAEKIAKALGDKKLVWKLWPNVYKYEKLVRYRSD